MSRPVAIRVRAGRPVAVALCAVLGAAWASATGAPDAAAAPKCGTHAVASIELETPEILVTRGRPRREPDLGRVVTTTACHRATGRRSFVAAEFDGAHAFGGGGPLALIGGRGLLVEEFGGGAESEGTDRRLLDVPTGRSTRAVAVAGTDRSDVAVAGDAGLLSVEGSSPSRVVLRRPGVAGAVLAVGESLADPALGSRTAYWRGAGGVPFSAPAAAPAPPAARRPQRSPRGTRGPCEPAGSRTLLRLAAGRIYRTTAGVAVACAARSGRKLALTAVVTDASATGPATELAPISPRLVRYRAPVTGGRTALVVLDLATARIRHLALADGTTVEAAFDERGIAAAGASGLRWTRGTTTTAIPSDGPASDPAIAEGPDGGSPLVFWTAPGGPRAAPAPPG